MAGKGTILIIDDEVLVQNLLGMLLECDGFDVLPALSGGRGLDLAREMKPDAIILDAGLPDMDGFEVCQRLREMTGAVILFATAKDKREDVVRGLQVGADDYVIKPYAYEELVARLNACLRRQTAYRRPTFVRSVQGHGLLLDPSQRVVLIESGDSIQLTPKEFELLHFMIENRGQVLSADDILSNVWGPAYVGEKDLVKQFIRRLRSKLEVDPSDPHSIVTIRGAGYTLEEVTKPSGFTDRSAGLTDGDEPAAAMGTGTAPTRPGFRRRDIERALEQSTGRKSQPSLQQRVAKGEPRRWVWRTWAGRSARVAIALVFILAVSPLVAVDALPGGILYPEKRIAENVRLAFAADDARAVQLHLEFADRRLDEAVSLLAQSRTAGVPALMEEYETELLEASWIVANMNRGGQAEVGPLEALMKAEADRHNRIMNTLMRTSSDDARWAIVHAAVVLNGEAKAVLGLFAEEEPVTPMAAVRDRAATETPVGLAIGMPTSGPDMQPPVALEGPPQSRPSQDPEDPGSPTSVIAEPAKGEAPTPKVSEPSPEEPVPTPAVQATATYAQGRMSDNDWGTQTATPTPTSTPTRPETDS